MVHAGMRHVCPQEDRRNGAEGAPPCAFYRITGARMLLVEAAEDTTRDR
jgi:hypothetical protein